MQVLKDLKRYFHVNARGGQAPALRYARPPPFTVGRGPVPRRALGTRARIPYVGQDRLNLPVREQVLPNYSLFKVCKTLMSIVYVDRQVRKVL